MMTELFSGGKSISPKTEAVAVSYKNNNVEDVLDNVFVAGKRQEKMTFRVERTGTANAVRCAFCIDSYGHYFYANDTINAYIKYSIKNSGKNKVEHGIKTISFEDTGAGTPPSSTSYNDGDVIEYSLTYRINADDTIVTNKEHRLAFVLWIYNTEGFDVEFYDVCVKNETQGYILNSLCGFSKQNKYEYCRWGCPKLIEGKWGIPLSDKVNNAVDIRPYKGKTILVIGDSLTEGIYGGGWMKFLQHNTGMVATNIAKGGTMADYAFNCISDFSLDGVSNTPIVNVEDYDCFYIQLSTNGNLSDVDLYTKHTVFDVPFTGDDGESINDIKTFFTKYLNNGFKNQLLAVVEYIMYKKPTAKIFLANIPYTSWQNSQLADLRYKQIKEIHEFVNMPYIDAYHRCGISKINIAQYSSDGAHLKDQEGSRLWGETVSKLINNQ